VFATTFGTPGAIFRFKAVLHIQIVSTGKEPKIKTVNPLESLTFGSKDPHAEPLHVDKQGRAILFTPKPEQSIRGHNAPNSPFFVVILKGQDVFTGGDGVEHTCRANTLLVFDTGEQHAIRAVEELVFVGFLHGAAGAKIRQYS